MCYYGFTIVLLLVLRKFEKVGEGWRKFEKVGEGWRRLEKVREGSRKFLAS